MGQERLTNRKKNVPRLLREKEKQLAAKLAARKKKAR